jgi:uncharacterized protein (DUF2147 family)
MGQEMQAALKETKNLLIFGLLLIVGAHLAPANAQTTPQATPQGWWVDQTGKAGIVIAPCGANLCGNIEWLKAPLDPQGQPKTDIHNPQAALQSRPICGLAMLGGFAPDGSGGWTGGWVYDPEAGKIYKAEMHLAADGTLHLRGYIGIPMLGRTAVWTRPPAPLAQCSPPK